MNVTSVRLTHGVSNQMHQSAAFWAHVDSAAESLGPSTEGRLEHPIAAGQNVHRQRQRIRTDFSDVVRTVKHTRWKHVNNRMDFAKQARIVDPRQIARLSPETLDDP